jgi:hypothetical protein
VLERQPELEVKLYDALRESFGQQERTGLHLTALLNPRQTYWRNLEPLPLTDAEVGFFSAGRGHEDAVAKMLVSDFVETPEEEIDGIHLRPDFLAISDRIIPKGEYAEFKTRRSNLPKSDEEANDPKKGLTTYRDQVRRYMALKRRSNMYLIVLSLTEGKSRDPLSVSSPVYAVYKETMTDAELTQERDYLISMKILLNSPAGSDQMPLCWEFLCGKWHRALVREGGAWSYIPKCPYYQKCKPWETDTNRGTSRP